MTLSIKSAIVYKNFSLSIAFCNYGDMSSELEAPSSSMGDRESLFSCSSVPAAGQQRQQRASSVQHVLCVLEYG